MTALPPSARLLVPALVSIATSLVPGPLGAAPAWFSDVENGVSRDPSGGLHLERELRHLESAAWWGEGDRASDPTGAILDFRDRLAQRGVALMVVPVPARSALAPGGLEPAPSSDRDRAWIAHLRTAGIRVLDLHDDLAAEGDDAWCTSDTHWSPHGLEIAAARIADALRDVLPETDEKLRFDAEPTERTFEGDLARLLPEDERPPPETRVTRRVSGDATTRKGARILVLGDSHTLVFHEGNDLHAEDAGLPDHLARILGESVDLVGVRGSGSSSARINLYRRGEGALDGAEVVVWVWSVREATQEAPWKRVPLPPPGP